MPLAFISYNRKHLPYAQELFDALKDRGWEVFLDVVSIPVGIPHPKVTAEAIARCDVFILLWSKEAAESEFVTHEWNTAIALKRWVLVPVIMDPPHPRPAALRSFNALPMPPAESLAEIIDTGKKEAIPARSRWKWTASVVAVWLIAAILGLNHSPPADEPMQNLQWSRNHQPEDKGSNPIAKGDSGPKVPGLQHLKDSEIKISGINSLLSSEASPESRPNATKEHPMVGDTAIASEPSRKIERLHEIKIESNELRIRRLNEISFVPFKNGIRYPPVTVPKDGNGIFVIVDSLGYDSVEFRLRTDGRQYTRYWEFGKRDPKPIIITFDSSHLLP